MAGVSRQAVHKWFASASTEIDVRSTHLQKLAAGLGVAADVLLRPLPGLTPKERQDLSALLLWDWLYSDLDQFLIAVVRREARALARLVEAMGLYRAEQIAGRAAIEDLPTFARYIHPARREGLLRLWHWKSNRAAH
jgi:transcriptional regulator with XRE-family HTH domain